MKKQGYPGEKIEKNMKNLFHCIRPGAIIRGL
jgi:hypothetical protein